MEAHKAIASFEAKWAAAYPELELALRFFPAAQRVARSAFACIGYEIAHAAFRIREAQIAVTKLQWWADEFAQMRAGTARHPLTQALAESVDVAHIDAGLWQALVYGAIEQRDPAPASTTEKMLEISLKLYRPLAQIEALLFGAIDADAQARALALSRLLHETIVLPETLESGRLAAPLDLLARHQLTRFDLAVLDDRVQAAVRDWFGVLAQHMNRIDVSALAPLAAASLCADRRRAQRAAHAKNPLESAGAGLDRVPVLVVWTTWRAARRFAAQSRKNSKTP